MSIYYQRYCKKVDDAYAMAIRASFVLHNHPEANSRLYGNIPRKQLDKLRANGNGQVREELSAFVMPEDATEYMARNDSYLVVETLTREDILEKMLMVLGFVETKFSNGNGGRGAIVPFQPKQKDKK